MRKSATCLALALCAALWAAAPAGAAFGLNAFDVTFTGPRAALDEADAPLGPIVSQAGAHPFEMTTSFRVNGEPSGKGGEFADEPLRDALFTQMQGFAANPRVVPACSSADFLTPNPAKTLQPNCPNATAVGFVAAELSSEISEGFLYAPVYNIEPSPGKAARFGFWITKVPVVVDGMLNEETPNRIVAGSTNTPQLVEAVGAIFTLWGVPADPRHDLLRGTCINTLGESGGSCPASVDETPFITIPRACTGPLKTDYLVRSWLGSEEEGSAETHDDVGNPQGMIGCGALSFSPHLEAAPTSRTAASPAGMDIDLQIEDEGLLNPSGVAGSDITKAVTTFPEGVTLNPSQAEGLAVCSEAQAKRETASSEFGAGCPAESKVGSVEVETPLLEGNVLRGSLFVATPFENRFGTLIAVYMTVKEPERGIGILLAGRVEPDPATGRLVATFGEAQSPIPAAPISDFRVHLRSGARAPLITPSRCGTYTTEILLTPSADPGNPVPAEASFHIGSGVGGGPCPPAGPPPFQPGFEAGTLSNGAATHSPFTMRLTRRDGDQDLTKFAAALPPGVLASLVGVEKCSDGAIAFARGRTGPHGGAEELASPSCPPNSKIGITLAGAGVGEQLTFVPGSLYLAGPYNGAPLSVVSITPGVAGPFDVGTVVVRVALGFDPLSARAKADGSRSDPIPHILRGIPLAVRDLRVSVDRPNWTFNPTSCRQSATDADIFGSASSLFDPSDDVPVSRSAPFRAADCLELAFGPRFRLGLRGGTARGEFPALTVNYVPRPGDANLRRLSLLFPRSTFIENSHFRTICVRPDFAAGKCPRGAIYGQAVVKTPLLEEPLKGPVYLRSSDNLLPDAVLDLHGLIDVEVPVRIDSRRQRLRTSASALPDAPVSEAIVRMQGGKKGLIVNSRDLCEGKSRAEVRFEAQSTKALTRRPVVKAAGCPGAGRARHGRKR
jgi:hypothetical protein